MKEHHLSHLDQTMLRMYVRHLLFFEFPDPGHLEDAINALRVGFAATIRQLPFLSGTIRTLNPDTDRLALQYPESPSDELIDRIFAFSESQAGDPNMEYITIEKNGFPPLPVWREVFCPSLLKNHPGLDDEFAEGLISFKRGRAVPVFAAQANFIRGGLVLSVYAHHSAIDGTGITKLYQTLSDNTRLQRSKSMSKPDGNHYVDLDLQRRLLDTLAESTEPMDCPEVRYPGTPRTAPPLRNDPYNVVARIFVFPAATISDLAATLTSVTNERISSFVALVSLVWTTITLARSGALATKKIQAVKLGMAFDHRRNLDQHFKNSYLGNCVTEITTSVPISTMLSNTSEDSVCDEQLGPVASNIAKKLSSMTLDWLRPRLNLFSRTPKSWQLRSDSDVINGPDLFVTSWMHVGTECKWGIPGTTSDGPVAIRKPQSHVEGIIHILPKVRVEGGFPALEVLICLEE
jgi:hypothetical protein